MRAVSLLRRGLVLLGVFQSLASAQCPNRGTTVVEEVSNTQGKPYQAKEIRTIVTFGNDGAKQVVVTKAKLFRDTSGRIRVERFYDGTANPSEEIPADIQIEDNCGTSVVLYPLPKTAKVTRTAFPAQVSNRPYCEEIDLKNPPYTGPEGKFEDLGHKLIGVFEVRGERTSYYGSVQARLSGAPPIRVYEDWCSILLETPMGSYSLNDKPKREITTIISDVKQVEPDPGLFEVPKDFKMVRAETGASASTSARSDRP